MNRVYALSLLLASVSASAAGLPCSLHTPKGTPDDALARLTKVTREEAEAVALRGFADFAAAVSVAGSELENEHGCLIYSFDIRVEGSKGIEEVAVDAGTGKILSRTHETPKREAQEARQEAEEARGAAATDVQPVDQPSAD